MAGATMIFGAGLALLFLGLALVVPGNLPVGRERHIAARIVRGAGATLISALPLAIVMNALWRRLQWEASMPLANAQWGLFGLLFVASLGLLIWGFVKSGQKPIEKSKSLKSEKPFQSAAFEEVVDEPATSKDADPPPEDIAPPPPPQPHRGKKKSGGPSPFDFS